MIGRTNILSISGIIAANSYAAFRVTGKVDPPLTKFKILPENNNRYHIIYDKTNNITTILVYGKDITSITYPDDGTITDISITDLPVLNHIGINDTSNQQTKSIVSYTMNDINGVISGDNMFLDCVNLTTLSINTSKFTSVISMLKNCSKLTSIPELDLISATNTNGIFENNPLLTSCSIKNLNTDIELGGASNLDKASVLYAIDNTLIVPTKKVLDIHGVLSTSGIRDDHASLITCRSKGWNIKGRWTAENKAVFTYPADVSTSQRYKIGSTLPYTVKCLDANGATINSVDHVASATPTEIMLLVAANTRSISIYGDGITELRYPDTVVEVMIPKLPTLTKICSIDRTETNGNDCIGWSQAVNIISFAMGENSIINGTGFLSQCKLLEDIPYLYTDNMTNMRSFFYMDYSIKKFPYLNTSKVTNVNCMFMGVQCEIPLIDTGRAVLAVSMFNGCPTTALPLINLSNCTNAAELFVNCTNITSVPLVNLNKNTDANMMFRDCNGLETIPELDFTNTTTCNMMLQNTFKLTTCRIKNLKASVQFCQFNVDANSYLSNIDKESVIFMLDNVQTVTNSPKLDFNRVKSLAFIAPDHPSIIAARNKGWVIDGIFGCRAIFEYPTAIDKALVFKVKSSKPYTIIYLDKVNNILGSIDCIANSTLTDINVPLIANTKTIYIVGEGLQSIRYQEGVTGIDIPYMPTLTNISCYERGVDFGAFSQAISIKSFSLGENAITIMYAMLYGCTSLTSIPILYTSNATNMSITFNGCSSLTNIPALDTSKVTDIGYAFWGCTSLTSIPLLDTSNVILMRGAFNGCKLFASIPLLDTSKVTNMNGTFTGCTNLITIPELDLVSSENNIDVILASLNITSCRFKNIKDSIGFSYSTKLDRESILFMIANVQPTITQETLNFTNVLSTSTISIADPILAKARSIGWTLLGAWKAEVPKARLTYSTPLPMTTKLLKMKSTSVFNIKCLDSTGKELNNTQYNACTTLTDTTVSIVDSTTDIIIEGNNIVNIRYPNGVTKIDIPYMPTLEVINCYDRPDVNVDPAIQFSQSADLIEFNLGDNNISNMDYLLNVCLSLTTIGYLNTSNATSVVKLFYNTPLLFTIPFINTSKVTNIENMFAWCRLTSIPKIDVSKATNASFAFNACYSLTTIPELDLVSSENNFEMILRSPLVTSCKFKNIKDSIDFSACTKLDIDSVRFMLRNVQTVTTTKVLNFNNVLSVQDISLLDNDIVSARNKGWTILGDFKASGIISYTADLPVGTEIYKVTTSAPVTIKCLNATNGVLNSTNYPANNTQTDLSIPIVAGTRSIYIEGTGISSLRYSDNATEVYIPYMPTLTLISQKSLIQDWTNNAQSRELIKFTLGKNNITDMNAFFLECTKLTEIPLIDTSKATNASDLFAGCTSLTKIPKIDTRNVTNVKSMFNGCSAINTIPLLDTGNVSDMRYMLSNCRRLTSIPLLDTSKVTNMDRMFYGCSSLTSIPLLDTSKVTNMTDMFTGCMQLASIPLLNTVNVTTMERMFVNCSALTSIPLLNTSKVTSTVRMFMGCASLTSIPLLNTSNVINTSNMFQGCTSLTSIPLLNTSKVTYTNSMFQGCTSLTVIPELDLTASTNNPAIIAESVNITSCKFKNIKDSIDFSAATKLDRESILFILSNVQTVTNETLDFTNVIDANTISTTDSIYLSAISKGWTVLGNFKQGIQFTYSTVLTAAKSNIYKVQSNAPYTIKCIDTSNNALTSSTYTANSTLTDHLVSIPVNTKTIVVEGSGIIDIRYPEGIDIINGEDLPTLTKIACAEITTPVANKIQARSIKSFALGLNNISDMSYMFHNCTSLTSIPLSDTGKVTNMYAMFYNCRSLTSIPLLNTSKVTDMGSMFVACNSLTTIPLLDTSNVTNMSYMFSDCKSLTSIPLLDTSKVTNMKSMFYGCTSLTSIPLLDTGLVTTMQGTFKNCTKLTSIPALNMANVVDLNSMFLNCTSFGTTPLTLNTPKASNAVDMFNGCTSLTKVSLNTNSMTSVENMFYGCRSLTWVGLNLLSATNVTNMLKGCTAITTSMISNLKVSYAFTDNTLMDKDSIIYLLRNIGSATTVQTLDLTGVTATKFIPEDEPLLPVVKNKNWNVIADWMPSLKFNYDAPTTVAADKTFKIQTNTAYDISVWAGTTNKIGYTMEPATTLTDQVVSIPVGTTKVTISCAEPVQIRYPEGFTEVSVSNAPTLTSIYCHERAAADGKAQAESIKTFSLGKNGITDMRNMFYWCDKLTSIVSLDSSNATIMNAMFYACTSLASIPLLDTSKVTNMQAMFFNCTSLTTIPLLDTSKVRSMEWMFRLCENLTTIPLLDTGVVSNTDAMFLNCFALTSIPLLNTSNVTNMYSMFYSCKSLTSIPLLNTSKVTNMEHMFDNCNSLTSIPLLNTSNVTTMSWMFNSCILLTSIPLLATPKVTNMSYMFNGCTALTTIPELDTSKVTDVNDMFTNCANLTSCKLKNVGVNLAIPSPLLNRESVVFIVSNLKALTATQTLDLTGVESTSTIPEEDPIVVAAKAKKWTITAKWKTVVTTRVYVAPTETIVSNISVKPN